MNGFARVLLFVGILPLGGIAAGQTSVIQEGDAPERALPEPARATKASSKPAPTFEKVAYGGHDRQVLDFWKAPSDKPTPLVFYMHGGGWVKDDGSRPAVEKYLRSGISVVSISYRWSWQAQLSGVKPPLEWPMQDARRALQFMRSKATEWNIDKKRIGLSGQSAGGCTSLWLAFHEDMADPKSADPVARESTRVWCAAVTNPQTSLDPQQMKEWIPNSKYGGGAFGFMDPTNVSSRDKRFVGFLEHRERLLPWIREYSPIEHAGAGDPPVYLYYQAAPIVGEAQKDPTHSAVFGVKLQEKLKNVGGGCELVYPGAPDVLHANIHQFLIETLKK